MARSSNMNIMIRSKNSDPRFMNYGVLYTFIYINAVPLFK